MLFFFGSSRSWAAREARRKAKLTAKKRRRSIIQVTVAIFSLLVFSISMWSLRKMRSSALSIRPTAYRGNRTSGLGRMPNGTMKTAVSAVNAKDEMPKPPLEPEVPVSKMDNSSSEMDNSSSEMVHQKEITQESGGIATKSDIGVSTESNREAGSRSHGLSGEDTSSRGSSYDHDTTSHSGYRTIREEGDANTNPSVRGMTQEDSTSVHHEAGRVYNGRASNRNYGDGDVGKMEEVDILDSEEGGEGLVITLPKKKSVQIGMRNGKEDMVHARDNLKNARGEFAESGRRDRTGEGRFTDRNRDMSVGENYQNQEKESYTREAMNKREQGEYKYTRRESDVAMHDEGLGGVYRRGDGGGMNYPAPMPGSLLRDGREHRVATSKGDVSESSRYRN